MAPTGGPRARKKAGPASGGGAEPEQLGASAKGDGNQMNMGKIFSTVIRLCIAVAVMVWMGRRNAERDATDAARGPIKEPVFETVDSKARLSTSDAFLSPEEVEYLLKLIDKLGGWIPSETGMGHYDIPPSGFIAAARTDPIVARIEERIANVTGIPPHPHEDVFSLARITSFGQEPRGGHYPPYGLHHDSDTRPARAWTMIVYLEIPDEGGRTIFPLAGPLRRGARAGEDYEARAQHFGEALQEHFGGSERGYSRQVSFDPSSDHPFMDLLEESCRGDYGVTFRPARPGGAVLFASGGGDRRSWHAGCNVLGGTKVILQKFKEIPLHERAEQDVVPRYQPFVLPREDDRQA